MNAKEQFTREVDAAKRCWLSGDALTVGNLQDKAGVSHKAAVEAVKQCVGLGRDSKRTKNTTPGVIAHPIKLFENNQKKVESQHRKNVEIIEKQIALLESDIEGYAAMGESTPAKIWSQYMNVRKEWERLTGVGAMIEASNNIIALHKTKEFSHALGMEDGEPSGQDPKPKNVKGKVVVDNSVFEV